MNTSLFALLSLAVVLAYVHVSEASVAAAKESSGAIEAGSPQEDEHLIEDDVEDEEGAVDKRWMARLIRSPEKKWMARLIRSPEKKWMARLIRSPEKRWMARLVR